MIDLAQELADYAAKNPAPNSRPAPRRGGRWTDRPLSADLSDTWDTRGFGFGLAGNTVTVGAGGSGGWDNTTWPGFEHSHTRCAQCQRHLPQVGWTPPGVTLYCDECIEMRK